MRASRPSLVALTSSRTLVSAALTSRAVPLADAFDSIASPLATDAFSDTDTNWLLIDTMPSLIVLEEVLIPSNSNLMRLISFFTSVSS